MKLLIPGNVPSQKNRKIISQNRATGRPFLRTAPQVKVWQTMAERELREQFYGYKVTDYPISLNIAVYFNDLRKRDLDNALGSIMDALVAAEIIEDDNNKFVDSISISYGGLDKLSPRAEVFLDE